LIGRWIGYLLQGKFGHTDVLQTPPLRGELLMGLVAHYSIGFVLTLVYLGLLVVPHNRLALDPRRQRVEAAHLES